jgi:glycosyltransferase involved in cell wall biosynthesis
MLIDVTRLVHRGLRGRLPTGIDRVCLAYVERYGARSSALLRLGGRWRVLERRVSQQLFAALTANPLARASLARSLLRGLAAGANPDRRHRLLINAGHSGLEHPRHVLELQRRQMRGLYVLHDLIPIQHPGFARPGQDSKHRQRLRAMLDTARLLVVNSQATCDELANHAGQIGRDLPECVVAPLAPTAFPRPSLRPPLDAPYFVALGTIEPRKNHQMLLGLWRRLVDDLGPRAPQLVVIGQPGWGGAAVLRQLRNSPALRSHVRWLKDCGDAELGGWLTHARAVLFPSLAEGYGLPLVEALSLRVPVIASELPAFREVAGGIPEFLDPRDEAAWQRAILAYADPDGPLPRLQRQRMAAFAPPTWDAHFSAIDAVVDECLREERIRPTACTFSFRDLTHVARP